MRRVALAFVSTVAGLAALLSFKTHTTSVATPPAAVGTAGGDTAATPSTTTPSSDPTTAAPAGGSTGSASSSSATETVTGDSVDTRWGPVQVKITATGGKVTSATAVVYPQENPRDQEINSYAIPTLQKESVGATTSSIDMVSGATYTSDGYIQSLQSALDKL